MTWGPEEDMRQHSRTAREDHHRRGAKVKLTFDWIVRCGNGKVHSRHPTEEAAKAEAKRIDESMFMLSCGRGHHSERAK